MRANFALFLITVAIVLFSLLRSVLGGPSGQAVELKPRSRSGLSPQSVVAGLKRHSPIDCSLTLDSISSINPANPYMIASKLQARASAQSGAQKK
jgi:hypothetical protein